MDCHLGDLFRARTRLPALQPGPRLCSPPPHPPALFSKSPGGLSRYPGAEKQGPPWLPEAGWGPACLLSFGPRKAKISLTFVPFLRSLDIVSQERIIVLWGPYLIMGCGGGDE